MDFSKSTMTTYVYCHKLFKETSDAGNKLVFSIAVTTYKRSSKFLLTDQPSERAVELLGAAKIYKWATYKHSPSKEGKLGGVGVEAYLMFSRGVRCKCEPSLRAILP